MYTPPGMDAQADPLAVALSQWQTPPNNQGMPYYGTPNYTGVPINPQTTGIPQPMLPSPQNLPGASNGQDPFGGGVGVDSGKQAAGGGGFNQGVNPTNRFAMPVSAPPVTAAPPTGVPPSAISTPLGGSLSPAIARPMLGPGASMPNSRPFGFGSMFGGQRNG